VIHQENSGVTVARKKGVEKSKGEYICFLDGDDTLPVDALLLLLDKAKLYDLDILVTAKNEIQNDDVSLFENTVTGLISREQYIEASLLGKCAIGASGSLIKKKLFAPDIFEIHRKITNNEDLIMNLRLGLRAEKIGIFNDIITYNYMHHDGSASSKGMGYGAWLKLFACCDEIVARIPDNARLKKVLLRFKLRRVKKAVSMRMKQHNHK
jgi:glycosyltransferase involved in cell wall biosynthesis